MRHSQLKNFLGSQEIYPPIGQVGRWLRCAVYLIVFLVIVGGCRKHRPKEELLKDVSEEMQQLLEPMQSTPLLVDGIESPKMVAAEGAQINPRERVIGVVMDGQARAYPLFMLAGTMQHVVNDFVLSETGEPKPFTVTYCDLTECVRVLAAADDRLSESLGIGTLGLIDGGLALRWEGQEFQQEARIPELKDVPYQLTTWWEWRALHPETVVYAEP